VSREEEMEQSGTTQTCWNCGTTTTVGQGYCHYCGSSLNNQQLKDQHNETIPTLNVHILQSEHTPDSYSATGPSVAGTMLGRRYRVVRVEGTGSFGTIYKAQDTRFQSGRVVAVKEMSDVYLDAHEKAWGPSKILGIGVVGDIPQTNSDPTIADS
jgi:hypothetical protein